MNRSSIVIALALITVARPSVNADKKPEARAIPTIAGLWQEGPAENQIQVTIVQDGEKFTADGSYKIKKDEGGRKEIRWRMTGTITKDRKITGDLVHTKAPPTYKNQTRTAFLSADGKTITGHATFDGGGHDFVWSILSKPATPTKAPEPMPMTEKPRPKSLPYLTAEEEAKIDAVIAKFIQWDIMQPEGGPSFQPKGGAEAVRNFEKLGREAIPALIRGLNKAAGLEHSCPTLVISKKLSRMLLASEDEEVLDYAREMIGVGVGRSSHARVLEDIRLACMKRKKELARKSENKADK